MQGAKPLQTTLARRLGRNTTDAELKLWGRLRARGLGGQKFVRQEPVGPYVVDFLCRGQRLVIELDGGQHAECKSDELRDQWLLAHNYRVLRFWNNDVLSNMSGVLETIANALSVEAPPHPTSSPTLGRRPLPAGGER